MEKIIKEKFDSFEVAPSAGLFDAILAKRKQKKRLIWIWSAASILLIGTAYFGWTNIDQTSHNAIPLVEQESNSSENLANNQSTLEETAEYNSTTETEVQQEVIEPIETIPLLRNDVHYPPLNKVAIAETPRSVEANTPEIDQDVSPIIEASPVKDKTLAEKFLEIVKNEKNNDVKKAKLFVKDKELVIDAPRTKIKSELPALEIENLLKLKTIPFLQIVVTNRTYRILLMEI